MRRINGVAEYFRTINVENLNEILNDRDEWRGIVMTAKTHSEQIFQESKRRLKCFPKSSIKTHVYLIYIKLKNIMLYQFVQKGKNRLQKIAIRNIRIY